MDIHGLLYLFMQDAMDSLDDKLKGFFKKCAITPTLKPEWRDEQMGKIKQVCKSSFINNV